MKLIFIVGLIFATVLPVKASGGGGEDGKIDVKSIVLGHMSDAYDWHITTYEGHHISIPLLVIVKGENSGWHAFSSSKVTHGDTYNCFYINEDMINFLRTEKSAGKKIYLVSDFYCKSDILLKWFTNFKINDIFEKLEFAEKSRQSPFARCQFSKQKLNRSKYF